MPVRHSLPNSVIHFILFSIEAIIFSGFIIITISSNSYQPLEDAQPKT